MKQSCVSPTFFETSPLPHFEDLHLEGRHCLAAAAPAKLNLFLHVIDRRADGYHLLQTVFQFLDWADELHFSLRQDGKICLNTEFRGLAAEDNLIIRAARLLCNAREGESLGCDISINKKLPMGAGLGGGSSNAATTLVVLNHLWDLGFSRQQLVDLGAQLGADVPVFVLGHACWAEGVGDQMTPVDLHEPWFFLIRPRVHVNTAEVFADAALTRNCSPIKIADFDVGRGCNVCEPVVTRLYPEVAQALEWMNLQAAAGSASGFSGQPRMTGTGSCLFFACESQDHALQLHSQLPDHLDGHVAKGANCSALYLQGGH